MTQTRGANERGRIETLFEASLLTRYAIVFLVKARRRRLLRPLYKPRRGLPPMLNAFIKIQRSAGLAEAYALRFVAEYTSIPVPKVFHAFVHKGESYIVMERIEGDTAAAGWLQRSEASRAKVREQLRRMLAELRAVPCPEGAKIGALDGGPFWDCRLPSRNLWGPFDTVRGFHAALVGFNLDVDSRDLPEGMPELLQFYKEYESGLVATHGDLSSLNILVKGDKVIGIVDWETSGWFPPYWEYTCTKNANPNNLFWTDEVDSFLTPMPHELEMDRIRLRYSGPFGL